MTKIAVTLPTLESHNHIVGEIGKGKHIRVIVDEERFIAKARTRK